ncbi:MAG: hydroxyacid dehydrogenase [Anaerolineaceae bacterium]
MKPYRILLYEEMHKVGTEMLAEKAELIYARSLEEDALIEQVADVDALIIRANGSVTARIMDAAPRLKVIGRHGIGVDAIDLQAAKQRSIVVCNTPFANVESVAEQAVGFMIAVSKQIARADKAIRQNRWGVRYEYIGQELYSKILGMVGMGRIGGRVAEICHLAFGMPVIYYDLINYPEVENKLNAKKLPLEEVLKQADYISLHVPLTPSTKGMIGEREFAMMKKGAFFINTARGPIVDETALVDALRSGHLGGAGLDVFAVEPPAKDNPLFQLENVVLTPHMSAHTEEAMIQMSLVAEDVLAVLEGKTPKYRVV